MYVHNGYYNNRLYGIISPMKISQKGLYALQAMMALARHYNQGAVRIRNIAYEEDLPEKFLELILLELKNARMVESVRGAKGGYRLRRPPEEIALSEIIRLIDGALAPFGDAEQLRSLIDTDAEHRALYQTFLDVRNAAAKILENTTLHDVIGRARSESTRPAKAAKHQGSVIPTTAQAPSQRGKNA
jgi:Rrf2 family transcriptional regulator, cysteine metabolism repressor